MPALSVAQMREADRRCIEDIGIPSVVLMENAGRAVFREVEHGPVGVLCGKGNNGGDGFVTARHALLAGHDVRLVLLADPDALTADAAVFMRAYRNLGGTIRIVRSPDELAVAVSSLQECAVLVDAVLGTGVSGEVRGLVRDAIEAWPALPTIAVDVPSGLNADTGAVCGACVRATTTVTFQFSKHGFEAPEAKPYVGRLVVADIGIPEICGDDARWRRFEQTR